MDDPRDLPMLLEFLRERDVSCPRCGYNLRNLTQPVCPECRESLDLRVGVPYRPVIWLLITTAPCAFCLIAVVIFCVMWALYGGPGGPNPSEWFTLVFLSVSGLGAIALGVLHRRFLRLNVPTQAFIVAAVWMTHIAVFVGLVGSNM